MGKQKIPFYKKPIVIILLFIFIPFIGIPLLFKFSKKPSQKIKIVASVIWSVLWVTILVTAQLDSRRNFDINGQSVTISCSSYCSYIDDYGDKGALKELAAIGIKDVKSAPQNLKDNSATIIVESPSQDTDQLVLEYSNGHLSKVSNSKYPTVIYFSTNSSDKVTSYPGADQIAAIKEAKQKEEDAKKAAEKAAAEQQAKEEAARQAAEAAVPTAGDTAALCEEAFHKQYPYSRSKVHSVTGLVTNSPYDSDTRLYKVGVTIENGFGAKYDAVMECVVKKSGNQISINSFNIYR